MSDQTWTEPGIYEVGTGVYRIPLPLPNDGLRAVNVYAITDGDGLVMVDSGWALDESRALLERSLAEIDHRLTDVREFLVTHVHRDHFSQAVAIRRELGTSVSLGEGERVTLDAVAATLRYGNIHERERLARAGAESIVAELGLRLPAPRAGLDDLGAGPDVWLTDGTQIPLADRVLHVVATPGHTRGHVVFVDPDRSALFAGDHVLPHITPSIAVELRPKPLPLADYLDSLRLVRSMPDTRLFPAHGPVTDSVHARVDELLDHHEERLTACAKAVEAGADTAYEAARVLRWTRRERHLDDMDLFNRTLAVMETLAHLDLLVARGWLRVAFTGVVAHYFQ